MKISSSIFSSALKTYRLTDSISDKILGEKLLHFLKELEGIDDALLMKEINYIDDSQKYKQNIGRKLLEIISQIDSEEKPQIIGKLFKNILTKNISYDEFLRLSFLVRNIFISDLLVLKEAKYFQTIKYRLKPLYAYQIPKNLISQDLFSYGLVENLDADKWPFLTREESKKSVILTTLGAKLFEFGLK